MQMYLKIFGRVLKYFSPKIEYFFEIFRVIFTKTTPKLLFITFLLTNLQKVSNKVLKIFSRRLPCRENPPFLEILSPLPWWMEPPFGRLGLQKSSWSEYGARRYSIHLESY